MASCIDFAALAKDQITIQELGNSATMTWADETAVTWGDGTAVEWAAAGASADVYGGRSAASWVSKSTPWAIIQPISGREVFAQDQQQSRVTHKFIIRYSSLYKDTATAAQYRVSFDDRIFPIKYVRNLHTDMKRHGEWYQELFCEEAGPVNNG